MPQKRDSPEIIARIRFYSTKEGGRAGPTPTDTLRCMFVLGEEMYDCVLVLKDIGSVRPGETVTVPIQFLVPDLLRGRLESGDKFYLRELRVIAEGVVQSVFLKGKKREFNTLEEG